ncbi:hypothetical protein [Bacillus sp. FJAT-50079]|uniref:coiled-coil domain-containing protein n=1 Tax=Bacillus sp. FJAT-50079 TaxID=2833577 RepID=UPI001BCA1DB3|nr:hypothetical protein [Bacillus sp. FJAT-50079]MBS4210040.1 hypothetical protein [Bacillus sp. FJAT-50079]
MGFDMHNRQMELMAKLSKRDRIKRRLTDYEAQLKAAEKLCSQLHKQLTKEQQDVAKLGKFSFMNIIDTWTGKWDEKMDKEVAEAAEAELKYNEAKKTLLDLETDTKKWREQMEDPEFTHIDADWEEFVKEKECWLRRNDSQADQALQKIADERAALQAVLREIEEAQGAGNKAFRALNKARKKLNSAEGMSTWDTFLGGGLLVSAMKYSEMNQSEDLIQQAQRALRHFKTELMDVQNMAIESFTINNSSMLTFTDLFFDNIFSDWMVHSRITEAKSKVGGILHDVRRVQDQLASKCDEVRRELERLDEKERDLIIS